MSEQEQVLYVMAEDAGMRLDQYLPSCLSHLSRARAQDLILSGCVLVNKHPAKPSHKVREGEIITVSIKPPEPPAVQAERIPLDIVFEDAHLIIVNKPAGMIVHPAAGAKSGTLVNALMAHSPFLSRAGGADRPGIIHRLDKNTSGLLIVAKTDAAHRLLAKQIGAREIKRQYRALVYGEFSESSGTIDAPIGRSPSDRKRMAVTGTASRHALTHFAVIENFTALSHLRIILATGRTHQIRVHMAYIGHPVVGDAAYGTRPKRFLEQMEPNVIDAITNLRQHMLHAETLGFQHPVTGESLEFTAPLPDEFSRLLKLLKASH
ncbi:MAG: RluA family pseudouridine synthase [Candidatus Abyssobacteria bacterium SURF_5]|uniref:Pseudouridine synthase n=1 Tax=Abyssobacteria bacterium (strain SURF_5) TaxID=2093360 RepID=A0A3A4NSV7_ABYX5|nr:MAG: RluA family pseudouridine synthase [Candidatus Abyssubacteria bacterium SURF_5]